MEILSLIYSVIWAIALIILAICSIPILLLTLITLGGLLLSSIIDIYGIAVKNNKKK